MAAADGVAFALHAELPAAARAPEEQLVEVFGHLPVPVELHARALVPLIVVVPELFVKIGLYLLRRHGLHLLGGEQHAHGDVHAPGAVVQVVLGRGQIAAGDLRIQHGHPEVLEQVPAAERAGLVGAGDGAHALRKDDEPPAGADDAYHLADGIGLLDEVLLRHHLHDAQHGGQVAAEELVVADDKIEGVGPESRRREHIVDARGVVGHHHVALAQIGLYIVGICKVHAVFLFEKRVRHVYERPERGLVHRLERAFFQFFLLCQLFRHLLSPSLALIRAL